MTTILIATALIECALWILLWSTKRLSRGRVKSGQV